MVVEDVDRGGHQVAEDVAPGAAREVFEDRLVGDVVGGAGARVAGERSGQLRATPDQEVAVANAGRELDRAVVFGVGAEGLLGGGEELGTIFGA